MQDQPEVRKGGTASLVVPVKSFDLAKTRLLLPRRERRAIALALARRTVGLAAICAGPDRVHVATSDPEAALVAESLGVAVAYEREPGLNPAAEVGVQQARAHHPGTAVGVLVADLPLLSAGDLMWALERTTDRTRPSFVPDRSGAGTTFVSIPVGQHLPMLFGPGSAARFAQFGCRQLTGAPRGLRADLDTPDDLADLLPMEGSVRGRYDMHPSMTHAGRQQ